ncbi:Exodeoxyribonuclease I [Handroanthus impetiginosus]|uniref:Exodeoxyribonuclease I n=1 Tax=Handroanthus impetiginosus TaxID=429701 RepID=A0A2G9HYK3_9LAMI|nr:Exodeoxyribonuclease I [Handroanthus impetiginosus]
MDKFGQGVEFKNTMLQYNKELNLAGFTQMMLLEMCILSGCDYLPSLPGMGLKKAYNLIKKFKSHENVIKHLKYNNVEVTPLYEESFKKAIMTFRHQRVYDPITEDIVHLSEPTGIIGENLDFLGPSLPQHVAKGIAQGDLDPFTKDPFQRESGTTEKVLQGTYQLKNFKPDGERKKLDLPAQKNLVTNYFCFASLEAKRKFKAPRITPKQPNDSNETSSRHTDAHEVKQRSKIDDLNFMEARNHGQCDDMEVSANAEMKQFTVVQTSVCKPCISLHKDLDSDQENRKSTFVNKNGIVRSSYFLKTSEEENGKENKTYVEKNGDNKLENVVSNDEYEPPSGRNEEKIVNVQDSYFQHNVKQNAADCKIKVNNRILRARSSYFEENSLNENNEVSQPVGLVFRGGVDNESLECTMKKRKIAQSDSPIEGSDDNNSTSDIEEEKKAEEGKFGCNISHLDRYSNIADKSMEKFISVISSFRYNSSGSRASGLRAPLKDIKNNCTKSSTTDVDLTKFTYVPTTKTTRSRCPKTKV